MKSLIRSTMIATLAAGLAFATARAAGEPDNRCLDSRITLGNGVAAGASALFDGSDRTGLRIPAGDPEGCKVLFIGAPRWFDRVDLLTDAGDVMVEFLDGNSVWQAYGDGPQGATAGVTGGAAAGAASWRTVEGGPVLAQGLRVRSAGPAQLLELAATFGPEDPDKAGSVIAAAGFNYHADWVNLYPGAGNDLSECDDDAEGLGDKLPSSWDTWLHGDYNAYEEHFKLSSLGGTNGDHVDNADLAYFSGHGTTSTDLDGASVRSLMFGDTSHDDQTSVPGECEGAWDNDLEWMCFMNCQTMADASRWHDAMSGTHLILGFETNSLDTDMGRDFGRYMNDSGVWDSAVKIKQSWFDAAEDAHGPGFTAMVIGETSSMGNDYLHGEGSVAADPTHDGSYSWWKFDTTSSLAGLTAGAASVRGTQWPHESHQPLDPVRFDPPAGRGVPVVIDRSLLDPPIASTSMTVYNVIPASVDSGDVRMQADRFCARYGRFCGGDIGPGDPSELNLYDGAHELRVDRNTGAVRYTDRASWLEWRTARPQLLLGTEAITRAGTVLENLGLDRTDAVVFGVDYAWQGESASGLPSMTAASSDSTFPIASRVIYRRVLPGGFAVAGPGASMTVALGNNGALQRVFVGGWRRLVPGASVNIVPVTAALNHVAQNGSDGTVDGLGPFARQIQVDSWELGYYEYSADVLQNTVRPVYIFHVTVTETPPGVTPPVTSQHRVCVWAESLPADAGIQAPADSTTVPPGTTVCFTGSATGGIAPYAFQWRDDTTGEVLGTGATLCAPIHATPAGHTTGDDVHSITLTVRDALGRVSHDAIRLVVPTVATGVEGDVAVATPPAAGARPEFEAILPNPTLGSARIRFSVPVAGEYRVSIYDVAGRRVRSIAPMGGVSGSITLDWDGRGEDGARVAAGVYYARVEGAGASAMKRIVVVR